MAKKKTTKTKATATTHRTKKGKAPEGAATATAAPAEKKGAAKNARPRPAKERKRSPGLLDLAADVLRASKQPMTCAEMVEAILAKGSWTTKGKTPGATLNASVHREIAEKGKEARFRKVERGRFAAAGAGR